ncbi:FeoB-associated Cys-rich membrane protein [Chryseobacterium sp. SC28]|nr:FeoB-associated Cys-rich membrane protein [Chryseobacterium sp. SC28]RRQ47044.1 FeoB-associated Cys-rich membrane protein [Chryseobacterium sp. SC28]
MDNSLIIQYIIIGLMVLAAVYFSVRKIVKTFSKKSGGKNCGPDCGCS